MANQQISQVISMVNSLGYIAQILARQQVSIATIFGMLKQKYVERAGAITSLQKDHL